MFSFTHFFDFSINLHNIGGSFHASAVFHHIMTFFGFFGRYESQKDHSLIGEVHFAFDSDWVKGQIKYSLEFWRGDRDATYLPEEERWKCKFCTFASQCPINTTTEDNTPT